jgi:hypothetical protein
LIRKKSNRFFSIGADELQAVFHAGGAAILFPEVLQKDNPKHLPNRRSFKDRSGLPVWN